MEPRSLHNSLAALDEHCRDLRSLGLEHLRVLQGEKDELNRQVEALNAERATTATALERLQERIAQGQRLTSAADQRAADLSAQLSSQHQAFEAELSALRSESQRLGRQLEDKGRSNQELRQQVSARAAELEQLRKDVAWVGGEKDAYQQRSAELESQLSAQAEAVTQAERVRDESLRHAEELQQQLASHAGEVEQLRKDVAWVGGEKDAYQQRTAELESQLSAQAEAVTASERAREQLSVHASSIEQELATTRDRAELLSLQLTELQEQLEVTFLADCDKQQRIGTLGAEVTALRSQLEASNQARDEETTRISQLQMQVEAQQSRMKQLATNKDQVTANHQQILEREQDLRRERESVRCRNELLQLQVQELQEALEETFLLARGQQSLSLEQAMAPQPAVAMPELPRPTSDSDAIKGNRSRLLAAL